jgi:hypothetical protein
MNLNLPPLSALAVVFLAAGTLSAQVARPPAPTAVEVVETDRVIRIETPTLAASLRKRDYVTGIGAGTFLDRKTGFRDPGFGLDILDWIMEPGSDAAYRDTLKNDLPYNLEGRFHGKTQKRCVDGPQMCHAPGLSPVIVRGADFVAAKTSRSYTTAAPGRQTGSTWTQTLVFPAGRRYFLSSDRMTSVNSGDELFFRMDMPGHIKHNRGDTFSEIYLSYRGVIPASEFLEDFAPDAKFNYRRDRDPIPRRFIRAYHLRDPKTGKDGPWLAGMTLNPADVYEAWCHQRGYVCFIQENGGRPVKPGESFGAAFVVGYFDSIEEMEQVYDRHAGHSRLEVDESGWALK